MDKLGKIAICLASLLYLEATAQYCRYFNQSKQIPYTRVHDGFKIGTTISVEVLIKPEANNFTISILGYDLWSLDFDPNITLDFSNLFEHVNKKSRIDPRVTNGSLDESSKTDTAIKIDLTRQEDRSVKIKCNDLVLLWISPLNNTMWSWSGWAFIGFSGDIKVNSICYHSVEKHIHWTSTCRARNYLPHDLACSILYDRSRNKSDNGILRSLHEGFEEGNMVLIYGSVKPNAMNATVFIRNPNTRNEFSLYFDFERKQIKMKIASAFDRYHSEMEKTVSNKLLKPNETFNIEIIRLVGGFLVEVNGLALAKLPNELNANLSGMAYLEIIGDVTEYTVYYKTLDEQKQAYIPVGQQMSTDPANCLIYDQLTARNDNAFTNLSYGFEEGNMLTIIGTVEHGVEFFEVSILNSNHDLAFHLNVTVNGQGRITNLKFYTTSSFTQLVTSTVCWVNCPPTNFKIELFRQTADTFVAKANEEVLAVMSTKLSVNLTDKAYIGFSGGINITSVCSNNVKKKNPTPSLSMHHEDCANNMAEESLIGILVQLPYTLFPQTLLSIHAVSDNSSFVVELSNIRNNTRLLHLAFNRYGNPIEFATDHYHNITAKQPWIEPGTYFQLQIRIWHHRYIVAVNGNSVLLHPKHVTSLYPQLIEIKGSLQYFGVCLHHSILNKEKVTG